MKVRVDLDLCRSYGLCAGIAPETFCLNEDGVLEVLQAEVPETERARVEEAALACPTQAIFFDEE